MGCCPDCTSPDGASTVPSVGVLEPVICEPDTNEPVDTDGVFITYEYLGQLIRRANTNTPTHCTTCTC